MDLYQIPVACLTPQFIKLPNNKNYDTAEIDLEGVREYLMVNKNVTIEIRSLKL